MHANVYAQKIIPVDTGWARNTINTTIFRKNSLVTFKDYQFIAFYNDNKYVVLAKRKLNDNYWQLQQTPFTGDVSDAHRSISIMVDGEGYLHLSWDHHNNILHYAKSVAPLSLEMKEANMTGKHENSLTYPEFYKMPDGDLLFIYRDGGSGRGNLVLNKYDMGIHKWSQLHSNLIDGEGKRNAYWQAFVDVKGTIHLSWVWLETPDVATNHDMCYACSKDGGITWEKSSGEKYTLPINARTAEYALHIPQQHELINQTSMYADAKGNPYIATYWREDNTRVPQYHVIYKHNNTWKVQNTSFRTTPFSLSGAGTKRIPISRPQVIAQKRWFKTMVMIIFRDEERKNAVSIAINKNIKRNKWLIKDILLQDLGFWEPSYDTELFKHKRWLHLFIEKTEQGDNEGKSTLDPQPVQVLEWKYK